MSSTIVATVTADALLYLPVAIASIHAVEASGMTGNANKQQAAINGILAGTAALATQPGVPMDVSTIGALVNFLVGIFFRKPAPPVPAAPIAA